MIYMNRIGDSQSHMPVNAGARIPTRRRLTAVINSDGNHIRCLAEVEMRCEFIAETNVAEWSMAEMDAVDPNVAVSHHAVKFEEHATLCLAFRRSEVLPIPAHPGGQKATRGTGWILLIERSLDTPIVRYIELPPVGVIKSGLLCARRVTQTKPPIRIELKLAATLSADGRH